MARNTIELCFKLYRGDEKIQWHRLTFGPDEAYAVNVENAYTLLFDLFKEIQRSSVRITYAQFIDFLHGKYPWAYAGSSEHRKLLIIGQTGSKLLGIKEGSEEDIWSAL